MDVNQSHIALAWLLFVCCFAGLLATLGLLFSPRQPKPRKRRPMAVYLEDR
jgi:hypothetical protein